jgi:hypothetical protein
MDARVEPGHDDCARSAKAALRDWQDTIADRAPVAGAAMIVLAAIASAFQGRLARALSSR